MWNPKKGNNRDRNKKKNNENQSFFIITSPKVYVYLVKKITSRTKGAKGNNIYMLVTSFEDVTISRCLEQASNIVLIIL